MASITLPIGKNRIAWIGATTTINASNFSWFTTTNVNGINLISTNRLGYISNKPTTQYPAFTQFVLASNGTVPNIYELDLKVAITLDSSQIYVISSSTPIPTIVVSPSSLASFSTPQGTPSTAQNVSVSGSNLTAGIAVTRPAGYEVSLSSASGYTTSVTVPQTGGTASPTLVYIRLTGTSVGSQSGNLAATSAGAATVNIGVVGTVTTAGSTPTVTDYTPGSGSVGDIITVRGTNFIGASAIAFGGTAATTYTVVNAGTITATVPAGAATGAVSVTVGGVTANGPNFIVITVLPKKLVYIGDSEVNSLLATSTGATTRLATPSLATQIISHPGEGAREYLDNHMAEVSAARDPSYNCYAVISDGTNPINARYIDLVKSDFATLCQAILDLGYIGIVFVPVGACTSPYAYAVNSDNSIIGGSDVAARRAGFDSARMAFNAYVQTLVGTKVYRVANLSQYAKAYQQSFSLDPRYFYAANTGPYAATGFGEPGGVHYNYAAKYWAEAVAQAAASMLNITLSPSSIIIPDAPDSAAQAMQITPTGASTQTSATNLTANSGASLTTAGGLGDKALDGRLEVTITTNAPVSGGWVLYLDDPTDTSAGYAGGRFGVYLNSALAWGPIEGPDFRPGPGPFATSGGSFEFTNGSTITIRRVYDTDNTTLLVQYLLNGVPVYQSAAVTTGPLRLKVAIESGATISNVMYTADSITAV